MNELLKCVDPAQVIEEDYPGAIAGETRPQFARHLEQCAYCQSELNTFRHLDSLMHQQFGFISSADRVMCVETQRLGDFMLGLLTALEARQVKEHLKNCPYCPAELAEIGEWLKPKSDPLDGLAGRQAPPPSDPWNWLRRVVAMMLNVGQLSAGPGYALAGVRGGPGGLPLTYQAEEVSVTVTVQPVDASHKQLTVLGLVQRDNYPLDASSGAEVRLTKAGTTLATETVDEMGNFVFAEVLAAAPFDLEIALNDKIVMVPNLTAN